VTSEVPRPDEPIEPEPAPDSPAHGDHTPDDHLGRESSAPVEPGPTPSPAEPGRETTPKGGCVLVLLIALALVVGVTVAPLVLLLA
jgi:hypothetical protein